MQNPQGPSTSLEGSNAEVLFSIDSMVVLVRNGPLDENYQGLLVQDRHSQILPKEGLSDLMMPEMLKLLVPTEWREIL